MSNLFHPEVIVIPATPVTESLGGAEAIGRRAKNAIELFSLQEATGGFLGHGIPKANPRSDHSFPTSLLLLGISKIQESLFERFAVVTLVGVRGHDLADR